jgi:AcrR family transcriptional regulator
MAMEKVDLDHKTVQKDASTRSSAEERREEILGASIQEFARFGLYGTCVDDIAARVGISQPYIFRLFGTKKELFIAAACRVCERIERAFAEAVKAHPDEPLKAMARAYKPLLASRAELLVLLHAFAASEDDDVRSAVAARYAKVWDFVAETSGATRERVRDFFASGMGMTVGAALGLQHLFAHSNEDEKIE